MGGTTSLNWAWRNPTKVVAWAGHIPLINLTWVHDNTSYEPFVELGYGVWLSLPGTSGAYSSTPDHASLDITGDIDVRVEAAATDWTPGAIKSLIGKSTSTSNQRSWRFEINAAGRLQFMWCATSGGTQNLLTSTVAPTVADGAKLAVRVTFDADNGAGQHVARFYTAPTIDGTWTQLGAAVTAAGVAVMYSSAAPVDVGSVNNGTTQIFSGRIYRAQIRNGIDGTLVADAPFNYTGGGSTSFADSTGKTWTVHGTAFIDSNYNYIRTAHDPYLNQAAIAAMGVPMAAWYGLEDGLCPPQYVEELAATVGSNFELFPHSDASNNGHNYKATNDNAFVIADWLIPKMLAADV
jgi:hypothetical protein